MSDADPVPIYHAEQLGPARASVTLERRQWLPSGEYRFVLTETFEIADPAADQPDRRRQISVTDVVDDGEQAHRTARELADVWSRSSDRADQLAPGGHLPELAPAKRERARGIPGLTEGATKGQMRELLRSLGRAAAGR